MGIAYKLAVISLFLFGFINDVFADDAMLKKAKTAIDAYFHAILAQESTLAPNMAMATAVHEVSDKDQDALASYYDQVSLSTARQAVDQYAKTLSEHKDTSNAADVMHEVEDALSPENLQQIQAYYKQQLAKH